MSNKKNKINKERIYDSMLDTINYNEKLVKDELDLTAKLEVSNVFTQPQQVPNGTLPQHTTNLNQVETMFEMFKRELRGYNLAMPDLTGKEHLGNGVYRLYDLNGITIDYNIFNGQYKINGTWTGSTGGIVIMNYSAELIGYTTSISVNIISGLHTAGVYYRPSGLTAYELSNFEGQQLSIVYDRNQDYIRMVNGAVFNDFTYTVQIEKGDTATPYTVPGQIPQYKIVGEE